ncbi:MAG: carbon-nitrogen hydrolase family protein [Clostridiaceae bacterium]
MKLAMAQMSMTKSIEKNFEKTMAFMKEAHEKQADFIFFPEIQLSPFFPQYEKLDVSEYLIDMNSQYIEEMRGFCKDNKMYASPNVYLNIEKKPYDASLMINTEGEIEGISTMVHIAQCKQFYEQDYYTPSIDGFNVYDTDFGKIGIVVCFDRHLPESIRTCALKGADLVIVPTANVKAEPLEMFEWEIRVQAMQNCVFIAMCNRVGLEGDMDFAGESIIVDPNGDVVYKGDDREGLITKDIDLSISRLIRSKRPYLDLRRPEMYL